MAFCSRVSRICGFSLIAFIVWAAVSLVWVAPARAGDACGDMPRFGVSMARFRYALHAPEDNELGVEVRARALSFAFANRACTMAYSGELLDLQAPDFGDPDSRVRHFLGTRVGFLDGDDVFHIGVRLLTWATDELAFFTPMVGARLRRGRFSFMMDVELPGIYGFNVGERPRSILDSLLASVVVETELSERLRLETRAQWRNYRGLGLTRDLTFAAGVSLSLAGRDGIRGTPGFIGLGARSRTDDNRSVLDLLLLLEFDLGAVGYWPQ